MLAGTGVLAIWNGITAGAEDDFVAWHVREHIPERVGLPGFLRGRRYVAVDGHPKFFNFYETASPAVLSSPVYLARLDAPTDWTRQVVQHFTDTSRTICAVRLTRGLGDGAALLTLEFALLGPADDVTGTIRARIDELLSAPGIVALHLMQGDNVASTRKTAEKALRDRADAVADWIVMVEGVDTESLAALAPAVRQALTAAGAGPEMKQGLYRLQFDLSKAQLGAGGDRT
jgi:hypothetical protein